MPLALFPADRQLPNFAAGFGVQVRLKEMELHRPRQWGACWLVCYLYEQLGLDEFWAERLPDSREGTCWQHILQTLVCYRLIDPGSEWRLHRQWFEQSAMADLLDEDYSLVEKNSLYRCLDKVLQHKEQLFGHLRQRWQDLFGARFEVLLYDLTSTYFESDPVFEETDKRQFGYSRDKRSDCVQVVIGLIITPEGFPLAYEVLPGNTSANRLMDELATSRDVIQRRAEAEKALREIAARITAIRTPGDLLQHVVDEAQRLLRADGAVIDQFNPDTERLEWAYDAGLPDAQREAVRSSALRLGEGLSGTAVALGRVMTAGDYLSGEFPHDRQADVNAAEAGIGDLIVAPIIGESGPLGAIEVFSHRPHAFDAIDEAVLGGLADQAAIAFTNARLIEELERSRATVARRAETERALREITARIAALREPDVILRRVVDESRRLLGTDGAHLTRMSDDRTYLVPVVVAGWIDAGDRAWLQSMQLPLGGGINGLAARFGETVWTADYSTDPRIPHEPDDVETAERLVLVGMAAAPLRAPGGEVIGTLAVSTADPRAFDADELDLLQGLADQAAIAITNSSLLGRLTESETRYRYLVERAPDLVWSIDADAKLTFVSDAVVRLTGATRRTCSAGTSGRSSTSRRATSPSSTGRPG